MNAPSSRSPRKAKGQGAERREEILAAALSLFTEFGIYAVSTRQIAQAVGISQPTLYAYFPTKDDIGHELQDRAFALLARKLAGDRGPIVDLDGVVLSAGGLPVAGGLPAAMLAADVPTVRYNSQPAGVGENVNVALSSE